jgi:hypothetical protein
MGISISSIRSETVPALARAEVPLERGRSVTVVRRMGMPAIPAASISQQTSLYR